MRIGAGEVAVHCQPAEFHLVVGGIQPGDRHCSVGGQADAGGMDEAAPGILPHVHPVAVRIEIDPGGRCCHVQPGRRRGRQRCRARGVREVGVARQAVHRNERADLVAILCRRVEPCVAPGGDPGGGRGHEREHPVRSIGGAMHLEPGLVSRVVLPGEVDPAVGHGDDVGVGWGVRGPRRQRRRAGGVREIGVARPAVSCLDRADLVAVLCRRIEPEVAPGSDTGGRRGQQHERPGRSIYGAMHFEAGLVVRIVPPGDIDPTVGHGDDMGVRR